MAGPSIVDLGDDVFCIDTAMGGYQGITASYLIRGSRPCLVETGTALSADAVIAALGELGVGPDDLAAVVVTHIHLDHAGGTGHLAGAFPQARVIVHERGARHLADPERLLASARRVFGADMDRLFGELRPTPGARIVALGESDRIDLGDGRILQSFHSPGHASHHVGLLDSQSGSLFTGDAAGVYVPATADVRPATPPPDFDLDLALDSLRRMQQAGPSRLLFSHFGPVDDADATLERSADELRSWVDIVSQARREDPGLDHAVAMVRERTRDRYAAYLADPGTAAKFEELSSTEANVAGIMRWLDTANA